MAALGKTIVVIGSVLIVVGLILWFGGDRLGWLGHLPGDVRVERPGFRLYAPITTMILLSIVLSVILTLIARFFK